MPLYNFLCQTSDWAWNRRLIPTHTVLFNKEASTVQPFRVLDRKHPENGIPGLQYFCVRGTGEKLDVVEVERPLLTTTACHY